MKSTILNDLNNIQRQAVSATNGPVIILAGAGSGKTRVLTYRTGYLIGEKKVPAGKILMVTFTNKAAGEMKDRIAQLLKSSSNLPFAGTFHSLCARILRIDGKGVNVSPNFVIYDERDQLDAISQVMKKLDISVKKYHPRAILNTISQAKNELIDHKAYQSIAFGAFQEVVANVYSNYQKLLESNYALDFDDLLTKAVELLQKNQTVKAKYHKMYDYIHIDEYQDTNKAQYALSGLLTNSKKNICVVGDASQSIYRWRGADFRNINNFIKDYPGARKFHLKRNYRSTQTILDAANSVISKNTSHLILELFTDKKSAEKIVLYEARNERSEAEFIIQTVLQSARDYNDYAILYRTNAQSRVIEEALLHAGIPYTLIGGIRFYERKEIKDVLCYLRLIRNSNDSVSKLRAIKIGKRRYQDLVKMQEALENDKRLVNLSTLEYLDKVLDSTKYLNLYDPHNEEDAYRLENIKELRSVAAQFPLLNDFLENVALVAQEYYPDELKKDKSKSHITLMTMHAAKGLEYPVIFLVGMEEGLFPHSRTLIDKDELEEERRLCYVGITRAKEKIYLLHASRRMIFGSRVQNVVSRFIADIPEEILDYQVSLDPGRRFNKDDLLI